jgi:dGTPase
MILNSKIQSRIKENYQIREDNLSDDYACKNSAYKRIHSLKPEELSLRAPFSRDADRILHSMGYARYIDKTQVFFLTNNDHITHRSLHVQLVSKIGRTIGRALQLNEDLIEAIALGHDIGHVPYGHQGESILNDICQKYGLGVFKHNIQSVKWLHTIESGHDLTIQVLDGILGHNGEKDEYYFEPVLNISKEALYKKYEAEKRDHPINPSTYEGCVVRLSDNIAYLARDIIDAVTVNLINNDDLEKFPEICKNILEIDSINEHNLVELQGKTIDILVKDIIETSFDNKNIGLSTEMSNFLIQFKDYNYQKIYHNDKLLQEKMKISHIFKTLFEHFVKDLENENLKSPIYEDFIKLKGISQDYITKATNEELVVDYIAGMTDRYSESRFRSIVLPIRRTTYGE